MGVEWWYNTLHVDLITKHAPQTITSSTQSWFNVDLFGFKTTNKVVCYITYTANTLSDPLPSGNLTENHNL